jgi:hypothetical protein
MILGNQLALFRLESPAAVFDGPRVPDMPTSLAWRQSQAKAVNLTGLV